jgi:hypothetical protein
MVPLAAIEEHAGVGAARRGAHRPVDRGLETVQHLSERCAVANQGGDLHVNSSTRSGVVIMHG